MNAMHVYHMSLNNLGKCPLFTPRIPENVIIEEDMSISRICVCPTIMGCIRSISPTQLIEDVNIGKTIPIYLYDAIVPTHFLYQPSVEDVPDVYYTGELWLMKETKFSLLKKLNICKYMDIPNSCYSRYAIYPDDENMKIANMMSQVICGTKYNFSYIDFNQHRVLEARNI